MASMSDFKEFTEAVKNLFALVFYSLVAFVFVVYGIPFIRAELKDKVPVITSVNVAGVQVQLLQASNTLNAAIPDTGTADVKVDRVSKPVAMFIDSSLDKQDNSFWVYLGQYFPAKNQWRIKTFSFEQIPVPNASIIAVMDVYKRNNEPSLNGDRWISGKIVGVVSANSMVTVIKVDTIADFNYWALVR